MVEPGALTAESTGHNETNLPWLLRLRWAALAGQLSTIVIVRYAMRSPIPIAPLLGLLAISLLTSLAWHLRPSSLAIRSSWLGATMVLDILVFSGLLYFTGGPMNPFSFLYLVPIALAAMILGSAWTWALVLLSLTASAVLFFRHRPLELGKSHAEHMRLHLQGMWIAFGVGAAFIVYFLRRIRRALVERDVELQESRNLVARQERLAALATLATGAAHELSTPLATIAVVARELERSVKETPSADPRIAEDVRLVRTQVERCRAILERLCVDAGEVRGERFAPATVHDLVTGSLVGLSGEVAIKTEVDPDLADVSLHVPARAIAEAIRGVLKNAQDASPAGADVNLVVRRTHDAVDFAVEDHGPGMSRAVLDRVGEPFFTTKAQGRGMGLGLFLARSIVERVGGSLSFDSTLGQGTRAVVRVPLPGPGE
ncbi:MAG TPA: ATP-binding protein [Polyangia bacterium]|jgi:two-component system sensor histidine kinase RegB|nr:ATP-binding protein [Polyangia bacterium]